MAERLGPPAVDEARRRRLEVLVREASSASFSSSASLVELAVGEGLMERPPGRFVGDGPCMLARLMGAPTGMGGALVWGALRQAWMRFLPSG